MIEFEYRQEKLCSGEIIYRPAAKVYLQKLENEWIAEYFYVDSGADYTLIPYRMGRFLNFERKATEVTEIGGIGGIIGVRHVQVRMKIQDYQFNCKLAWAQIERVPFLLGRHDVFEFFDIIFQQRNKRTFFDWQKK